MIPLPSRLQAHTRAMRVQKSVTNASWVGVAAVHTYIEVRGHPRWECITCFLRGRVELKSDGWGGHLHHSQQEPAFKKTSYFCICAPVSHLAQHVLRIKVSYQTELMSETQKENSIAARRFSNTSQGQHKSLQAE